MRRRRFSLPSQMLQALRNRNAGLDTGQVEDVILGCVTPVGEQGANIARTAVLMAGYDESVPGVQVNRFCASGLEAVNMAAAKVMSGQSPMAIGGGVEAMSRVPMALRRRRLADGSGRGDPHLFRAARHQRGPYRHEIRLSAATTWTPIGRKP